MKISDCRYIVTVINSHFSRAFRCGYNSMVGVNRCLEKYRQLGYVCEVYDNVSNRYII